MDMYDKAQQAAKHLTDTFNTSFEKCLITGSGAGGLSEAFRVIGRVPFAEVPHLVQSTYLKGEFVHANYKGQSILIVQGRLHYYEGYTAQEITFPIRILALMGIKELLMTNAAGGLNPDYKAGEIVLIKDHINLMPEHPLRGANDERFGLRFPDMSQAYNERLRVKLSAFAREAFGSSLREGVYVGFQGPSLETPAEYKYLHTIGGDMVGMSTVPEVIVANHCGIQVAVLSVVTNLCYPPEVVTETTLEEVIEVVKGAEASLVKLAQAFFEL